MANDQDKILDEVTSSDYKYGFVTDIETETIPKGLSEDVVRIISEKKGVYESIIPFTIEIMDINSNLKIFDFNLFNHNDLLLIVPARG